MRESAVVAVYAERARHKLRTALYQIPAENDEVREWRDRWWSSVEATMPGMTPSEDGSIGHILDATPTQVEMMIALEESKQLRAPVLYRQMVPKTGAQRLARKMQDPSHVWYGCKLLRDKNGPDATDVYVDATPLLPPEEG